MAACGKLKNLRLLSSLHAFVMIGGAEEDGLAVLPGDEKSGDSIQKTSPKDISTKEAPNRP
jgi:hypothetical protein